MSSALAALRAPGRPAVAVLPFVIVACSAVAIAGGPHLPHAVGSVLIAVSAALVYWLVVCEARNPSDPRVIATAIALVLLVAVVAPDYFSRDAWAYAFDGRTVAHYHASPYLNPPAAFSHDPLFMHTAVVYRHNTTPYGPGFIALAAVVSTVVGTHALLARLAFQALAAVAIAIAAFVVWRVTRSTAALALIGLHPVITASVVNGGHNDALVGLAVLVGALLLARDRPLAAGGVVAAATLVKVTAGLALIPMAVWTVARRGWRAGAELVAPTALIAFPITLLVPGTLHSVAHADHGLISRASPWNIAYHLFGHARRVAHPVSTLVLTRDGLILVAALVALAALVSARQGSPARAAVFGAAAWICAAPYFLPFYAAWSLPAAALAPRSAITRLLTIQAAALVTFYEISPPVHAVGHGPVPFVFTVLLPLAFLIGYIVVVVAAGRRPKPVPALAVA